MEAGPAALPDPQAVDTRDLFSRGGRLLLWGEPGAGKSTLAARLAEQVCGLTCVSADPGSPAFGVPGALCLRTRRESGWTLGDLEPLCSLDAARYRLPLLLALGRLLGRAPAGSLLLDPPGVVRGIAGAELLAGLVQTAGIDTVLLLTRPQRPVPQAGTLAALPVRVLRVAVSPGAHSPGKPSRTRWRSGLWRAYLDGAAEYRLQLDRLRWLAARPSGTDSGFWIGFQAGFVSREGMPALGQVTALDRRTLTLKAPAAPPADAVLLLRDAACGPDGLLNTRRIGTPPPGRRAPSDLHIRAPEGVPGGFRPVVRVGDALATLVNGVLGDPLLHLRLRHRRRSLLFDLGEGSRLPTRIAHQVSDVFVTHAHFDHIGGFLWLLRSRIGEQGVCRLWGPPGLAGHMRNLIGGVLWDRIGGRGPRFEVAELHGDRLRRLRLRAGGEEEPLPTLAAVGGVILDDPAFRVRAVVLDHGTPVLAYALETRSRLNVRKERLRAAGLEPGPWLGGLKRALLAGSRDEPVTLPDGRSLPTGVLGDDLVRVTPGQALVYATDLADTPENRRRLTALARNATVMVLEAGFLEVDGVQARSTGHLTVGACGEIAAAAGVERLVPFHFSRRYEKDPLRVYRELARHFPAARTVAPVGG